MSRPCDSQCSILILAGGRGSRMGGQDKGLIPWRGRPLIEYLHHTVRPLTDDLIISCNRNLARYARYADRLVKDEGDDFPGPLAGIRAALQVALHPWLLVLPCDAPRMGRSLLSDLMHKAAETPDRPLMLRTAETHWEPLFSVIPVSLAPAIEHAWQQGERSPRQALLSLDAAAFPHAADDPQLSNLNTPERFENVS